VVVFESNLKFTAYVMFRVGGLGMEFVVVFSEDLGLTTHCYDDVKAERSYP